MPSGTGPRKEVDILVVGAGVLGVTIAYWLSELYDCKILLVDKETTVAGHTSSRNTGVIHRPFYLNPATKKLFALSSELSYPLWHELAKTFGLPWKAVGTLDVALSEEDTAILEKYRVWGAENGIREEELVLLDGRSAKSLEPHVQCKAALFSKTDVSVDFGEFTRCVHRLAAKNGVAFLGGLKAASVSRVGGDAIDINFQSDGLPSRVRCKLLVNAAGGGAIHIAHMLGLAEEFSALYFRGEYWVVDEPFASMVSRNIYTPPRYPQFPFLDPHFVVRSDGTRQIGPNSVMVTGPYVYEGLGLSSVGGLLARPNGPKLNLLRDGGFLSMVANEWRSSVSKQAMCGRVRRFIPELGHRMLNSRGVSGVRSSIVGASGFMPEAVLPQDARSVHILNYNSPGATGAPAYSAMLVSRLRADGHLDEFKKKAKSPNSIWDFDRAASIS